MARHSSVVRLVGCTICRGWYRFTLFDSGESAFIFGRLVYSYTQTQYKLKLKQGQKRSTWMESISIDRTRAPSFESNAARGRPTTSDLKRYSILVQFFQMWRTKPVDYGNCFTVRPVAIRQNFVVDANILEAFYDRQRRTGNDRLDGTRRRLLADGVFRRRGWHGRS